MTRYLDTFFRHKLLLSAPLVLALTMSIWYVSGRPHSFVSSTTVWFDAQLPNASSIDQQTWNAPAPANQAQGVLNELIATRAFLVKVARRGPLADAITAQAKARKQPITPEMADELAADSLSGAFTSWVVGPQIVRITMKGPDPQIVRATLSALVQQYFDEVASARKTRLQAVIDYYQPQLTSTANTLSRARSDEISYLRDHPTAGTPGVLDPQYNSLAAAAANAEAQYNSLQIAYSNANQALATADPSTSAHVIDGASVADRLSNKKKAVFAAVGGLSFGIVLSLLGMAALTMMDTTARRREDLDDSLQVVATIQQFPESSRRQPERVRAQ